MFNSCVVMVTERGRTWERMIQGQSVSKAATRTPAFCWRHFLREGTVEATCDVPGLSLTPQLTQDDGVQVIHVFRQPRS